MKMNTSLIAAAATMALVGFSYSQTVIDVTGSTAGRSAAITNITAQLDSGYTYAFYGKDATHSKSDAAIYHGTYNGNAVIIRTYWSGSAAGVRDVADAPQLNNSYIVKTQAGTVGGTYLGTIAAAGTGAFAGSSTETVSEFGFSDVFQTSTPFTSNTLVVEDEVAIIPFKFFANDGSTNITNMTPGAFRNLYGALGEAPLSIWTGNPADNGTMVYACGRNNESGTRITTLAETGTGVFATINQWQYTTIASDTMQGVSYVGDSGYASGSDVAKMMAAKSPAVQPGVYVGYIGASDWSTASTGGGVELTYNGVAYSIGAMQNGQYTFWGYLHQFRMNLTGVTLDFYNDVRDGITATPGSGLETIGSMNVERAADGAPVAPL